MSDEFFVWQYRPVRGACVLNEFSGLDESFRLAEGVPLQEGFPGNVAFHMDPDFPDQLKLVDNLSNSDDCMIASPRLRQAIEDHQPAKVEYLPVSIIDHRGRVASSEYVIVHPIDPIDCIDRERSKFEESAITPGLISYLDKMVIDGTRVPPDRAIFRLKDFWAATLVRADRAKSLAAQGFSGLDFVPASKFPEK